MCATKTDVATVRWQIDDDLVRMREWGTDIMHRLPSPATPDCTIGTDDSCQIRVTDPRGLTSRKHCRLSFENARWVVRDLASKNGTFIDGTQRPASVLEPGVEIRIGSVTLIAESPRFIGLRGLLARLIGWTSDRTEVIDHALRAVRMAATQRAALVLCGDHDLVPVALDLHRHVLGDDRPFAMCDPRRGRADATVRSVENYATGMAALAAARGGSLCIWSTRRPRDFAEVTDALRRPAAHAQLIVCAHTPAEARSFIAAPITIPALTSRANQVGRVIEEYAADAIASLAVQIPFTTDDREWIRVHAGGSLAEIQKGTRRLVAILASDSIAAAAARLGMAPASLQEWINRRPLRHAATTTPSRSPSR